MSAYSKYGKNSNYGNENKIILEILARSMGSYYSRRYI